MKVGKKESSYFEDKIDLEISPSTLESLVQFCEERALSTEVYSFQGIWRERKDYLQSRFDAWKEERRKLDEER